MSTDTAPLSLRHDTFVAAFLKDGSAARAHIRAGIVELWVKTHNKQEQEVRLKLGKLQALAALSKQLGGLAAKPEPYEEHGAGLQRLLDHSKAESLLDHSNAENQRLEQELRAAREAPAEAQATIEGTCLVALPEEPYEYTFEDPLAEPPEEPERPRPPIVLVPGLYPNAKFTWSGGRQHGLGADSADALRAMKPGGFPGW